MSEVMGANGESSGSGGPGGRRDVSERAGERV